MQIKQIFGHLTGMLAAALAVLFVMGVVYAIGLLGALAPSFRSTLTFADIVNLSIRVSPIVVFYATISVVFVVVLSADKSLYSITQQTIRQTIVLCMYYTLIAMFYYGIWEELNEALPRAVLLQLLFGAIITIGLLRVLPDWRELLPLIFLPLVIFAMVSTAAAVDAANVKECQNPVTAVYAGVETERPEDGQVCPIAYLERGLLLYRKRDGATVLVPWANLTRLTKATPGPALSPLR